MPTNFKELVEIFIGLGTALLPLLAVVALLIFALGIARFIKAAGGDSDLKEEKKFLIWGIVGLFVLSTVWGIIAFIRGEFGFGGEPTVPQLPTSIPDVRSNIYPQ